MVHSAMFSKDGHNSIPHPVCFTTTGLDVPPIKGGGGVSGPPPFNLEGLRLVYNQRNTMEMMPCDFESSVRKGNESGHSPLES